VQVIFVLPESSGESVSDQTHCGEHRHQHCRDDAEDCKEVAHRHEPRPALLAGLHICFPCCRKWISSRTCFFDREILNVEWSLIIVQPCKHLVLNHHVHKGTINFIVCAMLEGHRDEIIESAWLSHRFAVETPCNCGCCACLL